MILISCFQLTQIALSTFKLDILRLPKITHSFNVFINLFLSLILKEYSKWYHIILALEVFHKALMNCYIKLNDALNYEFPVFK